VEECTYFWGVNTSWGIDTAESKGPLHQEDNQAPQPIEGMSRWFPSNTEIQKWIEEQEKDFAKSQNKNPKISTGNWLGSYIFTDIH
jgi:hypothetical protein